MSHFPPLLLTAIMLGAGASTAVAAPTRTPEQEVLAIAKTLKPIDDDQWKTIAGNRIAQKYDITSGDTLWDISKRLFGDARYWPKLWALNNDSITNPHMILPGKSISFLPGTGTSLPTVAVNEATGNQIPASPPAESAAPTSQASIPVRPGRSQQWRYLPKQRWESVQYTIPPEVDPLGFDTRNKIHFKTPNFIDPQFYVSSEKLQGIGVIKGSRAEGDALGLTDLVYINEGKGLQVGQTYTIVDEPQKFDSPSLGRTGYAYRVLGKVELVSVKDDLYLGKVTAGNHLILRGSILIPLVQPIKDLAPIPAKESITGTLFIDHDFSTYTTAQHHPVFIDRGTADGIQPGNIFRVYEHNDPNTGQQLTDANYIIDADVMVLQASDKFSSGLVINSLSLIDEGMPAVSLTDVSDLLKHRGYSDHGPATAAPSTTAPGSSELDELDQLDQMSNDSLGTKDQKELKQLEKWKGNPPEQPQAAPSSAPDSSAAPESPSTEPPAELPPENPAPEKPEAPSTPAQASPPSDEALPPPPSDAAPGGGEGAPTGTEDLPPPP